MTSVRSEGEGVPVKRKRGGGGMERSDERRATAMHIQNGWYCIAWHRSVLGRKGSFGIKRRERTVYTSHNQRTAHTLHIVIIKFPATAEPGRFILRIRYGVLTYIPVHFIFKFVVIYIITFIFGIKLLFAVSSFLYFLLRGISQVPVGSFEV